MNDDGKLAFILLLIFSVGFLMGAALDAKFRTRSVRQEAVDHGYAEWYTDGKSVLWKWKDEK